MYLWFGDPATEIWTAIPDTLDVNYPVSIPLGLSEVTVHVEDDGIDIQQARVCLWKGNEVYEVGYTNANGDVTLSVSPVTYGTMYVTVSKHNYLPYEGEIQVEEQTIPHPSYSFVTLTHTNMPGLITCPAGDGFAYQYVKVTVKNSVGNPLSGIPADEFSFAISNAEAAWYGILSCTFIPVDAETNANGEIRFTVTSDTSIVGDIQVRATVMGVLLNDVDLLSCKSMDYDTDGDVDLGDFTVFGQDWGTTAWRSDFTWDGSVNLADFTTFGQHWGHSS